eukprot:TRINITY_DN13994_c0_g1_i2.p1 TRINITY_DN13994_c0_g1~~TRINITY_DN13994_c0_g1_i2.p1  ORF type:complete len:152 (-),score=9.33 TRINITY_DN13994_c0_g1_i2:16-471(-)
MQEPSRAVRPRLEQPAGAAASPLVPIMEAAREGNQVLRISRRSRQLSCLFVRCIARAYSLYTATHHARRHLAHPWPARHHERQVPKALCVQRHLRAGSPASHEGLLVEPVTPMSVTCGCLSAGASSLAGKFDGVKWRAMSFIALLWPHTSD